MSQMIEERDWRYAWIKRTVERMDELDSLGEQELTLSIREFQRILMELLAMHQRSDRLEEVLCSYARYAFPVTQRIVPPAMFGGSTLAATMHEDRRTRPYFIQKPIQMPKPWGGMEVFIDEAKDIPPAMFGQITDAVRRAETATGATMVGPPIGSLSTDKNPEGDLKCLCGYKGTNKDLHSTTCKHYNWNFYHPAKPEHCHIFRSSGYGYDVCNDCGMSDVYYNWAYNKKS